jgi:hypothetical protein
MRPTTFYWMHRVRDYFRYLTDDGWYWCPQCRRPVEHSYEPLEENGPEVLTCMDCGLADPEMTRTTTRR